MNKELKELEILASLLESDYDIDDVIELTSLLGDKKRLLNIQSMLQQGNSLSSAICKQNYAKEFIKYFQFFEMTNKSSYAIKKALEICTKQNALKQQLLKKLRYPACLILFLILFLFFIGIFLMPQVNTLLEQFSTSPSMMQIIIFKSFTIIPFLMLFVLVSSIVCILILLYSIKSGNHQLIHKFINIKGIGAILKKYYSLSFALLYNELLKSGYDFNAAIHFMLENTKNQPIQSLVYQLYCSISQGMSLEASYESIPYFEESIIAFLIILSKQEKNNKNLDDYISLTIDIVQQFVDRIISIVLPITYLFIGTFVITVYLSIIIPLMDIVNIM